MAAALAFVLAAPVVAGLALRLTAVAEVEHLRTANATLSQENSSYREATGTLATQIESLQAAISELGIRARLDPVSARAMEKLPANIRNQAAGGTTIEGATAMLTSDVGASSFSFSSAQRTFGLLKNVLAGLESHLNIVRSTVEKREALMSATPSIWPIHGWLSAGFGMRPDPFTGQRDFHPGLDISADKGTPILATADGVVDLAAPSGDYGNLVVVNHGYGLVTRYGHLSKFAVWTGKRVQRGEVLGYVGATGRATGPHLHYEIFANGKLMNPMQLLAGKAQD
jgi:murein DD-endopeptidase MepM/ murein hydrolase activator NlpD